MNEKTDLIPTGKNPIKKIYWRNNKFVVDDNTLQYFGSETLPNYKFIQEWLRIPLPNAKKLNLPKINFQPKSPKPYIEIQCGFKKQEKKSTPKFKLEYKLSSKTIFQADFDLTEKTTKFKNPSNNDAELDMDQENYEIENTKISSMYYDTKILFKSPTSKKNFVFKFNKFQEIANTFFDYVQTKIFDENYQKSSNFNIYVLPSDGIIRYVQSKSGKSSGEEFFDCLGNKVSSYAKNSVGKAKFCTFNDLAYSLFGKKNEDFWKMLSIGKESVERITIDPSRIFKDKAQLSWIFVDLVEPENKFDDVLKTQGIFHQIKKNYEKLKKSSQGKIRNFPNLKVLCMKIDNSSYHVYVDENIAMSRLEHTFSNIRDKDIPFWALEVLIEKVGTGTKTKYLWKEYIQFVRHILLGTGYNYKSFINFASRKVHSSIFDWLEKIRQKGYERLEPKHELDKLEFCRTLLSENTTNTGMSPDEEFAHKVGRIAGRYIFSKKLIDGENNSLNDIVTYNVYDKIHLVSVYSKVSRGILLIKPEPENANELEKLKKFVSDNMPPAEGISEQNKSIDYAYFFYQGVFEQIT
ncbi:MAG: hypothetical protein ACREA7_08780, partial [Nitrosotalea sp.]